MILLKDIFQGLVSELSSEMLAYLQTIDPKITGIFFQYGHHSDVKQILKLKTQVDKYGMYPLIIMFEDYRIRHIQEGLTGIANLQMMIVHISKDTITREQRDEKVFIPILNPIYTKFLTKLKNSGKFQIYDETTIQHTQINRPHWGDPALYGKDGYLLDSILDGIELSGLELKTYLPNCQ